MAAFTGDTNGVVLKQFSNSSNGAETDDMWKKLDVEAGPIETDVEYAVDVGEVGYGWQPQAKRTAVVYKDYELDKNRNRWFDPIGSNPPDNPAPSYFIDGDAHPSNVTFYNGPESGGQQQTNNGSAVHYQQQQQQQQRGNGHRIHMTSNGNGDRFQQQQQQWLPSYTDEEVLLLAGIYIKDCIHSREEDFRTDSKSVRYYQLYNNFIIRTTVMLSGWIILLVALFEEPSVTRAPAPYWATMIVEGIVLTIFACRLVHRYLFTGPRVFFKKNWSNSVIIVAIVLVVIDIVTYLLWRNLAPASSAANAVRWSRPIRPVFLVFLEGRRFFKALDNIWRTIPEILHIIILWLLSMLLFSLAGYTMFKDNNWFYANGLPYFRSYFDAFWDLYTLVTTANNPDVMMPAYDTNGFWVLFFIAHEVCNLYVFLNIVLATIYNNYKEHLKDEVRATVYMHRRLLSKAFDALAVDVGSGTFAVTFETWQQLLLRLFPNMCENKISFMFYLLDDNHNDVLEKAEFLQLRDLFTIDIVEVKPKKTFFEHHCGFFYNSVVSIKIRYVITSKYFRYVFDLVTLANVICIAFEFESVWWAFLSIFTFEILAYLYAEGPQKYFTFKMNIFDCLIIIAGWITTIGYSMFTEASTRTIVLDVLLILRIVRVVRVAQVFGRFRIVLTTISKILPFILQYGCILLFLFYFYAIIFMEIFKGTIAYHGYTNLTNETNYCGNPNLQGSDFWNGRYCKNNFNNILYAFVVLYDLMIVNQWHVIAGGFILATNKNYRILFISFHITCVIILLNIFAAFILDAFNVVATVTKDKVESRIESKVEELRNGAVRSSTAEILRRVSSSMSVALAATSMSDISTVTGSVTELRTRSQRHRTYADLGGLRYKLKKKKNMQLDLILQQLFESEIDPNDIGETDETEVPPAQLLQRRRLTLSAL